MELTVYYVKVDKNLATPSIRRLCTGAVVRASRFLAIHDRVGPSEAV